MTFDGEISGPTELGPIIPQEQAKLHLPQPVAIGGTFGQSLTDRDREWLRKAAIDDARMVGIRRALSAVDLPSEFAAWGDGCCPAYVFRWRCASGRIVHQLRPDKPRINKKGEVVKYLFPKGSGSIVAIAPGFEAHQLDSTIPVLLVEGTKQLLAAASALPAEAPIVVPFGVAGCYGWSEEGHPGPDLGHMALDGREVVIAFDADVATNRNVYDAAKKLIEHLENEYLCSSVRVMFLPGGGKDGLDDLLGRAEPSKRLAVLRRLIQKADKLPKVPPKRSPKGDTQFFDEMSGGLKVATLWNYFDQEHHLAMAGDNSIAVYDGGVYWNGKSRRFSRLVSDALGEHYRPEHLKAVLDVGLDCLKVDGRVIPFMQQQPLLSFTNGLLDLDTGELRPHDPSFLTLVQIPFGWDPGARCPVFDEWLATQLPGQGDVLLDVSSQMLDQTRQPSKFVFLIGPSRTGKSTFLRLLRAIVGPELSSSVSLHSLTKERFAPAQLFGKVLNTFADLSADDLSDLSVIKALTGGDSLYVEYKGKDGFSMDNMAMPVFSANAIPAVSEASKAYVARAAIFKFDRTFIGEEDPAIEARMIAGELPGITRRLVMALVERRKRGRFLEGDQQVAAEFARKSDRVQMFLHQRTMPGHRDVNCLEQSRLYRMFCDWSKDEGVPDSKMLGKQKFNDRVRAAGVAEFKASVNRWNLLARPAGADFDDDPSPLIPQGGSDAGAVWPRKLPRETALPSPAPRPPGPPLGGAAPSGQFPGGDPGSFAPNCPEGQNADGACGLAGSDAPAGADWAVLPHSSLGEIRTHSISLNREWVETAQTAQAGVKAGDSPETAQTAPAEAGVLVTNREWVEAALEALRLAPGHPTAEAEVHRWLAEQGQPVAKGRLHAHLARLQAEEAEDDGQLGLGVGA